MKKVLVISCVLWALLVMTFFCPNTFAEDKSAAKTKELRLAHMFPVGSPSDLYIKHWADKIAKNSNGRLKIRIFPSNTLIAAPDMYFAIMNGVADIGFAWRYKPEEYTLGVHFPFLLAIAGDTVTAGRVYDDVWKQFPKVMAKEWKDVHILWLAPTMPVYLSTSKKPINTIEDIKGLQLRVPAPSLAALMKKLGASPAFISAADYIMSLEKGTVDGSCGLFSMIADYKLGGKIHNVLLQSLSVATPIMVIMNKKSYGDLPDDLKKVINDSTEEAKKDAIQDWIKQYDSTTAYCKANDIKLIPPSPEDQKRWHQLLDQEYAAIAKDLDAKGYPGTDLIKFIKERVAYYSKK